MQMQLYKIYDKLTTRFSFAVDQCPRWQRLQPPLIIIATQALMLVCGYILQIESIVSINFVWSYFQKELHAAVVMLNPKLELRGLISKVLVEFYRLI